MGTAAFVHGIVTEEGIALEDAKSRNDFSKGSIPKAIIRMAVPITLAELVNVLYNLVDRMYIGHMKGEGAMALTGLGICMPVIMLVTAFSRLCGEGGAPFCSIERGREIGRAHV